MEIKIKPINKNTDLSIIQKYNWDLVVKDCPYYVCRIPEYYHSVGGYWGNNDLWCYPRDEQPTVINLLQFSGSPVRWGVKADDNNYIRCQGRGEVSHNHYITITRNGEDFYSFGCNGLGYGLSKAQVLIARIDEHPINLNGIDFDKKVVGRKVWWKESPGIITRYIEGQACVIIEPDGLDKFPRPNSYDEDEPFFEEKDIKVSIFSDHIWWFRN